MSPDLSDTTDVENADRGFDHTGELAAFTRITDVLVTYDRDFPIVTP